MVDAVVPGMRGANIAQQALGAGTLGLGGLAAYKMLSGGKKTEPGEKPAMDTKSAAFRYGYEVGMQTEQPTQKAAYGEEEIDDLVSAMPDLSHKPELMESVLGDSLKGWTTGGILGGLAGGTVAPLKGQPFLKTMGKGALGGSLGGLTLGALLGAIRSARRGDL
jgi:hypothetical protein